MQIKAGEIMKHRPGWLRAGIIRDFRLEEGIRMCAGFWWHWMLRKRI